MAENDIAQTAYWLAWNEYNRTPGMPDEKRAISQQLRLLIQGELDRGERHPDKIAVVALGALRQQAQREQSKARVGSGNASAAA